jgi:hypothetical protein
MSVSSAERMLPVAEVTPAKRGPLVDAHRLSKACQWGRSRRSRTRVVGTPLVDEHRLGEACRWGWSRSQRPRTRVVRRGRSGR